MSNPFENNFKTALLFFCCFFLVQISSAQCVNTGTKNPTLASTVSLPGSGYSFSPASNIISSDNILSVASALLAIGSTHTNYLKASSFNFNIPATAAVCGIQVTVERSASNLSILGLLESYVSDYAARIVKNGAVLSTNRATSAHWTGSKTSTTYGGDGDLWGTTWMPADINNSNFGFAFSAYLHGFILGLINIFPSAQVDNITMTVFYNEQTLLPVRLTDFNLIPKKKNAVAASWKAEHANDNYEFLLQRSKDGINWQPVSSNNIQKDIHTNIYHSTDNDPYTGKSYYRVQMNPKQGEASYSESKTIVLSDQSSLIVYPNPCTQFVYIQGAKNNKPTILLDETGRQVKITKTSTNNDLKLDLSGLKAGIYVLVAEGKRIKILKQ